MKPIRVTVAQLKRALSKSIRHANMAEGEGKAAMFRPCPFCGGRVEGKVAVFGWASCPRGCLEGKLINDRTWNDRPGEADAYDRGYREALLWAKGEVLKHVPPKPNHRPYFSLSGGDRPGFAIDKYVVNEGDGNGHWYLFDYEEHSDPPPFGEVYEEDRAREICAMLNAARARNLGGEGTSDE